MPNELDTFYVGIKDPSDLRRALLESTKLLIRSLQKYEHFKSVREKKLETLNELKAAIRDINTLVAKLKTSLPKTKKGMIGEELKDLKKVAKPVKSHKKAKLKSVPEEKEKEKTELEMLEEELRNIERKLSQLE